MLEVSATFHGGRICGLESFSSNTRPGLFISAAEIPERKIEMSGWSKSAAALTRLHDEAARGCVGPVVGVLKAQDDVLALLHLVAHHVLHLLRALLQRAVAPPRRRADQACGGSWRECCSGESRRLLLQLIVTTIVAGEPAEAILYPALPLLTSY